MENIEIILGAMVIISVISSIIFRFKNKYIDTNQFEKEKSKIKPPCSEEELDSFIAFLKVYRGGYIKRRNGGIVYRDYLGKEKGDLKGIFYHIVVPSNKLSVSKKEEYRKLILSLGVSGVEKRPSYETRDAKIKNNKTDINEYKRKEVGNVGEQLVRNQLSKLNPNEFAVINGPVLKCNDVVKEYDHIVVGKTGVFIIETKAFGMTEGKPCNASLFIDKGDKWILRKNKVNKELTSPTVQVEEQYRHITEITDNLPISIHPVLVLSNEKLFVKNNIKLNYDVIRVGELAEYISEYMDALYDSDKYIILEEINNCRIN